MNQRTLIIERPASVPFRRRLFAFLTTVAAWLLLSLMWLPVLRDLLALTNFHVPLPGFVSGAVMRAFPIGSRIGIALIVLSVVSILGRQLWEILGLSRPFPSDRAAPLGQDQLAAAAHTSEACLSQWQAARTLYVQHDDHGQIRHVSLRISEADEGSDAHD